MRRTKSAWKRAHEALWTAFSAFIRARDASLCRVCGKAPVQVAYHLFAKGDYRALYFDEENVIGACAGCNKYELHHRQSMMDRHKEILGSEKFEELKTSGKLPAKKMSATEMLELAQVYREKTKALSSGSVSGPVQAQPVEPLAKLSGHGRLGRVGTDAQGGGAKFALIVPAAQAEQAKEAILWDQRRVMWSLVRQPTFLKTVKLCALTGEGIILGVSNSTGKSIRISVGIFEKDIAHAKELLLWANQPVQWALVILSDDH